MEVWRGWYNVDWMTKEALIKKKRFEKRPEGVERTNPVEIPQKNNPPRGPECKGLEVGASVACWRSGEEMTKQE